jgi:hypothetical protein
MNGNSRIFSYCAECCIEMASNGNAQTSNMMLEEKDNIHEVHQL